MAGVAQGVPTRLVSLSGLVDVEVGEKVRFLGWYVFLTSYFLFPRSSWAFNTFLFISLLVMSLGWGLSARARQNESFNYLFLFIF